MKQIILSLLITLLLIIGWGLSIGCESSMYICITTFLSIIGYCIYQYKLYGYKSLVNLKAMFICILFLYTNAYPIFYVYTDILKLPSIIGISNEVAEYGTLLANTVLSQSISIILLLEIKTKRNFILFFNKCKQELNNLESNLRGNIFDILALVFMIINIIITVKSGLIGQVASGINRLEVSVGTGQHWAITYYLVAYSCFVIGKLIKDGKKNIQSANTFIGIVRLLVVIGFIVCDILIGNRRFVSYIIIYILLVVIFMSQKIKFSRLIFLFIIAISIILIGFFRQTGFTLEGYKIEKIVFDAFGEFFIPINTFYRYIFEKPEELLYGFSYIQFLFFFIPRSIWASKPESLAVQFVEQIGGSMGYGFNLYAEAFLNFGYMFIIILPIVIALLLCYIEKKSVFDPYIYIFCFLQLINFCRGEFSSSTIEFIIMYTSFKLLIKGGRHTYVKLDCHNSK